MLTLNTEAIMPKSIKTHLTQDLLDSLDPAVTDVVYVAGCAKMILSYGERLYLNEQDLVTLLNFVRENQK